MEDGLEFVKKEFKNQRLKTSLESAIVSNYALNYLPDLLKQYGYHSPYLIFDQTTYLIAGKQIEEILQKESFQIHTFILNASRPKPDEKTVGAIFIHAPVSCDVFIAVGAGTMNDLCKFTSYQMGKPYFVVATAPSMDGFASKFATLLVDNNKTLFPAHAPKGIIGDAAILCKAPTSMVAAGFGEIVSKYICLCDWKIASIVLGKYYHEPAMKMIERAIKEVIPYTQEMRAKTPEAIIKLMKALILVGSAGIEMSLTNNLSLPVGCEHHLAHYWEMQFLFSGKKSVLHGTKVGVSSLLTLKLYTALLDMYIDFEKVLYDAHKYDHELWKKKIQICYQHHAFSIIQLEAKTKKNHVKNRIRRIQTIQNRWSDIMIAIQTLPSVEFIESLFENMSAPIDPEDIGVERQVLSDSILVAKEVCSHYTLLQLLWDLGLSEYFANAI